MATSSKTIIVVSPHFDDAVLSCFELISTARQQGHQVVIANVFTQGSTRPLNANAAWILKKSGFNTAADYFKARDNEDSIALETLKISRRNFGLVEGIFRRRQGWGWRVASHLGLDWLWPEIFYYYPNMKSIFKRPYVADAKDLKIKIQSQVLRLIPPHSKNIEVWLPAGIGNHVDHVIVRDAILDMKLRVPLFLWQDLPYAADSAVKLQLPGNGVAIKTIHPNPIQKNVIIKMYVTQFLSLFPNQEIPRVSEKLWSVKNT